jgi:hypothetical protein
MTHTPGPWKLGNEDHHLGFRCVQVGPQVEPGDYVAIVFNGDHENPANAALIAAAPDLLAAAIEAMRIIMARDSQWDLGSDEYRAVADLAVAIKKATSL